MSEIFTEPRLRPFEGRASEMAGIPRGANGGLGTSDIFGHHGRLGESVGTPLRTSANDESDWLGEMSTPEGEPSPRGFGERRSRVRIEYMTTDDSGNLGRNLADFLSDVFEAAGIAVAGTLVCSEHAHEDTAGDDEFDEDGEDTAGDDEEGEFAEDDHESEESEEDPDHESDEEDEDDYDYESESEEDEEDEFDLDAD